MTSGDTSCMQAGWTLRHRFAVRLCDLNEGFATLPPCKSPRQIIIDGRPPKNKRCTRYFLPSCFDLVESVTCVLCDRFQLWVPDRLLGALWPRFVYIARKKINFTVICFYIMQESS